MATEIGQLEGYGRLLKLAIEGGRHQLMDAHITGRSYGGVASIYDALTWMGKDGRYLRQVLTGEPPIGVVAFPSGICVEAVPAQQPSVVGRLVRSIRR